METVNKNNFISLLNGLKIANGEITEIKFLEKTKAPLSVDGILMLDIPARCEVYLTLKPSESSDIKVVVGLPLENWNGRFLGTGNGGDAGELVMQSVNAGVSRGFATANTDMGSSKDSGKMYGQKERWIDFGYRATHLMTEAGKQITEAFYGEKIKYSYFLGGSTGGQQALQEAQRYPNDYDGIAAFCPAYNRVNLHQAFVWDLQATCMKPESRFTPEQIAAVGKRVLELFVEKSGGAKGDAFLSYPGKINFTPEDVFTAFDGLGLSQAQLDTLKNIYSFPKIPGTDNNIYSPTPLGCETSVLTLPYITDGFIALLGFLQRWAFGIDFDYKKFDFDKDYRKMVDLFRAELDATNPDLSGYKKHGGKLILITGSNDSLIPYSDGMNYYKNAVKAMGGMENTADFFRYFHVPGLAHCSGGPGLQEVGSMGGVAAIPLDKEHDVIEAVMEWTENGVAPEVLYPSVFKDVETKNEIDYERPVFPYPYETEYIGGDRKDKNNFRKKLGNGVY